MGTMQRRKTVEYCAPGCPVEAALNVIGGKWKGIIVFHLLQRTPIRFGEFRRLMPGVSQRMLTKQLRELEEDEIVERKVFPEVPPKVEYSLSARGASLRGIILALEQWGLGEGAELLALPGKA